MMIYDSVKKYFTLILLLLLLQGCEQGSFTETNLSEINLPAGTAVMVYTGDRLIPTSEKTRISVTHTLEDGTRSVEILTGTATLIRGNYGLAGS